MDASKITARFWKFVVKYDDGCWEWAGPLRSKGRYGCFSVGSIFVAAHRFSWELNIGPIPIGLCVCHKCDNSRCVKPDHLFLGTMRDNMRDCSSKGRFFNMRKTHCSHGHPFSTDNTVCLKGHRTCRICKLANERKQARAEKRKVYYRENRERILARMKTYYRRQREAL